MGLSEREKRIIRYEREHFDKILLAIIGFVGIVFFWKGLATILEKIEEAYSLDPVVLLFFGLVIIFLTGAMIKR